MHNTHKHSAVSDNSHTVKSLLAPSSSNSRASIFSRSCYKLSYRNRTINQVYMYQPPLAATTTSHEGGWIHTTSHEGGWIHTPCRGVGGATHHVVGWVEPHNMSWGWVALPLTLEMKWWACLRRSSPSDQSPSGLARQGVTWPSLYSYNLHTVSNKQCMYEGDKVQYMYCELGWDHA